MSDMYDMELVNAYGNNAKPLAVAPEPPKNLVDPATLLQQQLTNLQTTLGTNKDADLQKLDSALAARGISRGG